MYARSKYCQNKKAKKPAETKKGAVEDNADGSCPIPCIHVENDFILYGSCTQLHMHVYSDLSHVHGCRKLLAHYVRIFVLDQSVKSQYSCSAHLRCKLGLHFEIA